MRLLLLIFWITTAGVSSQAQVPNSALVHMDKSFYVNGETIWYNIFLPAHMREVKVTLKVIVLDGNKKLQGYYFLSSKGDTHIPAYYKLPYDASSGMYQIIIWGRVLNSAQESIFAAVPVPVYNDLEPFPENIDLQSVESITAYDNSNQWSSDVQMDIEVGADIQSGSNQEITVHLRDGNNVPIIGAQVSISVVDDRLSGASAYPLANVQRAYPIPERRWANSIFMRGTLLPADDTVNASNLTLGGYLPPARRIFYSRIDSESQFVLQFPHFYETSQIQFISFPERDFSLKLSDALRTPNPPPLVYTEGIRDYLELSRQRKTIYQLFTSVEHPLHSVDVATTFEYPEPDRVIDPDIYEDFPDVATFLTEVVTPLRFSYDEKQDRYKARMYNLTNREFYAGAPLFIIDDQLSRDGDFVARLTPSDIESIGIFHDFERLFNQFLFLARNGLVVIRTKTGKKQLSSEGGSTRLQGLQQPAVFDSQRLDLKVPHIKPQVYWSADQSTDASGEVMYSFTQTDDRSRFRVHVVAQLPNGERIQGEAFYTTANQP